ncbi:beta strand repeat-containing protein [Bdellovibrio sp. HCB337]|uniref:beta strand repeat-containing protein n=1 Tax=Bdellovibrio sp. HCB337 TaxID=3394358 RepID=UPI0039A455A3
MAVAVVALVVVGSSLLPATAAMIPFGFWKSSVCKIAANITISSANVAEYSGCGWDIQPGVTVTVNYSSIINIRSLTIANTGVLTHRGCTTAGCTPIALNVSGDVTIASGGVITTNGLGYLGGYQTGPDAVVNNVSTGQTYNFAAGANTTAGGSHGGWGGWKSSSPGLTPNLPYGIIKYPDTFGAGGGGFSSTQKGGNGGGVVRMTIAGTLTLDGNGTTAAISANGADGSCGGGAGGSIDITAKYISSSTSGLLISANGGAGGSAATCGGPRISGGGGGGRIAINYLTGLQGTMAINSTYVRAYGGTQITSTVAYYGGSGTIAVGTPSSSSGDLYVYGPYNSTYVTNSTPIGAFGWVSSVTAATITFTNYTSQVVAGQYVGLISPDADAEVLVAPAITGTTSTTITNGTVDLTTVTSVGKLWTIYDTRYNVWDNVNIGDAALVQSGYLGVGSTTTISNTAKLMTANLTSPTININNTAVLSHIPSDSTYVGRLKVEATNVTIASGASINVDGMGYLGGRNSGMRGTNSSNIGLTYGLTTNGGSDQDTGGSHGGIGGYDDDPSFKDYFPGAAFDSISLPLEAGGGAGTADAVGPYDPGGNGGGVVYLSASGTLTVNGTISAKGGNYNGGYGGGGAGGSIRLSVGTITSSSAGVLITAAGGNGFGGGGGGRISISYTTMSGTMAFTSSKMSVNGGASAAKDGSAGTIFSYQNGVSGYGSLHLLEDKYSDFRGTVLSPYGFISSSTATTITDTGLINNARDFIFTKAQVVGKLIVVNPHLASTASFTITDYNPATGVFTVSGGSAAGLTANTYWYIAGFNTQYDYVYFSSSSRFRTPYLSSTNIISAASKNPIIYLLRLDASTVDLTNGSPVLDAWYSNGTVAPQPLVIAATTFTLGTNAKIDVSGSGYVGGNSVFNLNMGREGWANNNTNFGYTYGNTTTGGSAQYSGGSGAGYGGYYSTYVPASPSASSDPAQPFAFGTGGGGNTSVSTAVGGAGGGVVKMNISGTLTINGQIRALGYPYAPDSDNAASAGGGGSIWITANTITSSSGSTERVIAYGGYTGAASEASACGGGGGRLALYYTNFGGTFSGAKVGANGGPGKDGICNGGTGTEYYKKTSDTYGTLIGWNGSVPNYLPTPLPAYNMTLKSLEIYSGGKFQQMSSANSITVTTSMYIENAAGAEVRVPNDESNDGSYNNAIPVGTWFNASGVTGTITEY